MRLEGFLGLLLGLAPVAAPEDAITGTALFRERIALPSDAVFEAVLEHVSRADAPSEVVGRQRIDPAGNPPYALRIPYDSSRIDANHRYSVRATIRAHGELLFSTDSGAPVLTGGAGKDVDLLLKRVAGAPPPGPLENAKWKLTELNGSGMASNGESLGAHLIFEAEGRLAGSDGCNRLFGSYALEGANIRFGRLGSTMMACPDGVRDREFVEALGKAAKWRVAGSQLELRNDKDELLARFDAVRPQ